MNDIRSAEWTFVNQGGAVGINNKAVDNISNTPDKMGGDFGEGFEKKAMERSIVRFGISPLDTYTRGFATRGYSAVKALGKGNLKAFGSVMGGVAIYGLYLGIEALQKRVEKMENKAAEMNEKDNVLLRAGSVSQATFYQGNLWGVKSRTVDRR